MVPKKASITANVLRALLTRIGSASSGTKSTLLARFQREIQKPGVFHHSSEGSKQPSKPRNRKLRVMSIDMGIRNLAFCDAEVFSPATGSPSEPNLDATMNVLRWKKIDLVGSAYGNKDHLPSDDSQEALGGAEEDVNPYSPSVLSKTAYRLITEEVLSASPDIILIEKQRWRSGGGSAVQQWTVRVNTLEAMLWAILETLKTTPHLRNSAAKHSYRVYAIDPKRVGQYWLSRHARAEEERNESPTLAATTSGHSTSAGRQSNPSSSSEEKIGLTAKKLASRSKAEKSAKIALLRAWLSVPQMSTSPSSPTASPRITIQIAATAQQTLSAFLPSQTPVPRQKRKPKTPRTATATATTTTTVAAGEETEKAALAIVPAVEMKKLDDVTDCFLQAAAWVAWEVGREQMRGVASSSAGDEEWILQVMEEGMMG